MSCRICRNLHRPERPLDLSHRCGECAEPVRAGSRPLSHAEIDGVVRPGTAGSYALGHLDGGCFVAFYVGRADSDLNARLHGWVGVDAVGLDRGRGAAAPRGAPRRRSFPPSDVPVMRGIGPAVDAAYTHFRFEATPSAHAAFESECASYHSLGGGRLDSAHHPVPTDGTDWECPHAH